MKYAKTLKKIFTGIILKPEDLLHLETFQISYLPDRVPKREFATLIQQYPVIKEFLISKNPGIEHFLNEIFNQYEQIKDKSTIHEHSKEALWEIADLIVYNKYPEVYDENTRFDWDIEEINSITSLKGKTVVDAGAGTGQLAFLVANMAKTVFAIEPVASFRRFIRKKAMEEITKNIYVMDGFLHAIPLPDHSVDVFMTSNAIGWNLEAELAEIERVLKPKGSAVHLFRVFDSTVEERITNMFISERWGYSFLDLTKGNTNKFIYYKTI